MPTSVTPSQSSTYFPLDQGERASHLHSDQLLPRDIYKKLAEMLHDSLRHLLGDGDKTVVDGTALPEEFSRLRTHTAIFLDGDRGTGKTTVIVNLQDYLATETARTRFPGMADDIHVLQPIDSSQLEDNDDLFLNVVVAAVLGDADIQRHREKEPQQWQTMYESLQLLGKALAGKETQGEGIGLDRLRSFMGARELASDVHNFFFNAAKLLNKRLLVLPIDDVDTTLHRAFDNLEVVRRYLATPVLVPIVCGDLQLYRDVIRRDALRRLSKDLNTLEDEARATADALAVEYLRKILPMHRRMRMPEVEQFLQDNNIVLGTRRDRTMPTLSLPDLAAWLQALLAGPVNGHENSTLSIPIRTVRALTQLVTRVRSEIPALEQAWNSETATLPQTDLMRRLTYLRRGETAQRARARVTQSDPVTAASTVSLTRWQAALFEHFMFEADGGPVCLVLMAALHWHEAPHASVLATPLFAPHKQLGLHQLRYTEGRAELNWASDLSGRLPESWFNALPDNSILPFATPEVGRAVVITRRKIRGEDMGVGIPDGMPQMLLDLITHRNFYSESKRATLICSGRVLELVVTSLVRDITTADLDRILAAAPFHSTAAVAATKAIHLTLHDIESGEFEEAPAASPEDPLEGAAGETELGDDVERHVAIENLVKEINEWRRDAGVDSLPVTPWLIYCALNKAFNQAPFHTRPRQMNEQPSREMLSDVVASGLATFNAFWAAVASFEKGPIFDQPMEIANVNLVNRRGDFHYNDLYKQNIQPLLRGDQSSIRGESVAPSTRALNFHPLRTMLVKFFEHAKDLDQDDVQEQVQEEVLDGRTYFMQALKLPGHLKRISVISVVNALKSGALGVPPATHGRSLLMQITKRYPGLSELDTLNRAIKELERQAAGPR